jgi:hypothetical protein
MFRSKSFKFAAVFAGSGLLLAVLSLMIGASVAYVAGQLSVMFAASVLIGLAPRLPFAVALVLLATVAKNFAISQWMKVLLLQPADVGMLAPVDTAWAIALATLGFALAAAIYVKFSPSETWTTPLSRSTSPGTVVASAWVLLVAGVISKKLFADDSARSVILSYAGDLVYAATAAFAYDNYRRSEGRSIMDWRVCFALVATLAASVGSGSKFAMLVPFVIVGLLHVAFSVVPRAKFVIPLLGVFVALSIVIYPMVTYVRTVHGGAASIVSAIEEIMDNPAKLTEMQEIGDRVAQGWRTRLYYGRPIGMMDRFTPNQVADVVSVASYTRYDLGSYVASAPVALLPQTFGFARNQKASGQGTLETAVRRQVSNGGNSANYGLTADLALHGGPLTIFLGSALAAGFLLLLYTIGFGGQRNNIWAFSWGIGMMFILADCGLVPSLISTVHGAIIEWGLTLLAIVFINGLGQLAARSAPGTARQWDLRGIAE